MLMLARITAVLVGVGTFAFLFISNSWSPDNLFLVPDLIITAALVIAALLPKRLARPALLFAFGLAAGVLMTATSWYAIRGQLGLASLIGAAASAVMAALVAAGRPRGAVPA
jgi:hypothetical protein